MSDRRRASLDERVSWTTGFTKPADKVVLGALAFFADFETGRNSRPGMRRLVERADLPKRTVERSLRRLLDEQWITITATRHLGATTYALDVERLATSRSAARVVGQLSANLADNDDEPSSRSNGSGSAPLSANGADLSANAAATVRQPGGCTRDQLPGITYPSAPARDTAPAFAPTENATADGGAVYARGDNGLAATQGANLAARAGDVRADNRDRPHDDDGRRLSELDRNDQAAARRARLPLSDGADPPGDRRADADGPVQQSFGPLALGDEGDAVAPLGAAAPRQVTHLVTLGEVWRANLEAHRKRKAAAS